MSKKKAKPSWPKKQEQAFKHPKPESLSDVDDDIFITPDTFTVNVERGSNMFNQARHKLTHRFRRMMMQDPRSTQEFKRVYGCPHDAQGRETPPTAEYFADAFVHKLLVVVADMVPVDETGPIGGEELASVFGKLIGMAAGSAVDKGDVPLIEVEQLTDAFYVGLREGIPAGIAIARAVDARNKK